VKNIAEEGRVGVRNARRDARKTLETAEKDGDISKDELERAEKDLEKMTQEHVDAIDKATAKKEQEVMEV
jgi:ribosome recycling factor